MTWLTTRASLLTRVRNPADHAAWLEFDRRYGELIVRYCRSRGLAQCDAEDLRQVVLMNLASALRSFEYEPARGRFRSYLGRVVRNAIHRHATRPHAPGRALSDDGIAESRYEPADDEVWEREWMRHHLRLAMQSVRCTFDPRSVAAFERLLAGAPTAVVAREFELSVEAVHKVKQRIRDRLRGLVAAQIADEDSSDG